MYILIRKTDGHTREAGKFERTDAMRIHLATLIFGAALWLGGGCVFWQNTVRETQEYDPVSGERGADAPVAISYGVFRNVSGSSRRFMIRSKDGQIGHDEYIRWLNSPELLLERACCRWMPAGTTSLRSEDVWLVDGILTRFDFERGEAVAAVDFDLRNREMDRVVHAEYRVPVNGDSPAAMTAAMTAAMKQCVEELRRTLAAENRKGRK